MNKRRGLSSGRIWRFLLLSLMVVSLLLSICKPGFAAESQCAEVKIVIDQKMSLERQAFDARMVIRNGLDTKLEDIAVELLFWDENMSEVVGTQDSNATEAKFFYRVDSLDGIDSIEGEGVIEEKTTAEIHWLAIPVAGSAPNGETLYFLGAKVTYKLNGQETSVEVTPDYVVVAPLPMLTLDYFLPKDVYSDDPFTEAVEPAVPFTLGVRITNSGEGVSSKTMIESAQPRIVENEQNLLIGFEILGGYVSDQPAGKSLLLNFGDIAPHTAKVGRWTMVTTLSGRFVDLKATYSHADSLGGALTSLIDEIRTHTLVHDVKVNLPGRDNVRDFLARDGDVLRVYESDGIDTKVADLSAHASITVKSGQATINAPATQGFVYVQVADPHRGEQAIVNVQRSDGKTLPAENVWLSKTRNEDMSWSHFINIFDVDSTGAYTFGFSQEFKATLSGTVYEDVNGDGLQNRGEAGIPVVAVELRGEDEEGMSVLATAYTNADGKFSFVDLNPGRYELKVALVNGMVDSSTLINVEGSQIEPGRIANIVLGAGANVRDIFFAKRSGTTEAVIGNADLLVAALGSSTLTPAVGEHVVLTVMFGNAGPDSANDVVMDFALPQGFTLVQSTASVGHYEDGQWIIGTAKPFAMGLLQVVAKVEQLGTSAEISAQIGSPVADTDLSNNRATILLRAN